MPPNAAAVRTGGSGSSARSSARSARRAWSSMPQQEDDPNPLAAPNHSSAAAEALPDQSWDDLGINQRNSGQGLKYVTCVKTPGVRGDTEKINHHWPPLKGVKKSVYYSEN